ncbi:MAG TPA: glycosyltransferase family 4 protein [Spirochaetota bacterium]|nr:glycosyltransferase family 4 protein [Spirochaetota bacterium]
MTNKKLKILMLNYEFPPLGGGASPVSYEIAKGLVELGHLVTVVTMGYKDLPKYEEIDGIKVYRVKCLRSKKEICHPWEQLSYLFTAKKFLKKHLKTNCYDINHTHFIIPTGILSLWLKKKYGLEYVITAHGSDVPGYNPDRFKLLHKFTGGLLKKITVNCRMIISPSKYLYGLIFENIIAVSKEKLTVIPNGIYLDKFKPMDKKNIILSTGRLLPRKGFQYLINAVKDLDINYELHICGDGPMRQELEKLSKDSKIPIIFHGWIDNKSNDYKKLLGEAGIYVLASERENASVAILEAMSAGCAIITTNVSGCPETVGSEGVVVNIRDSKGIQNAIINLIKNNKKEEYSKNMLKRVYQMYDWNKIIKDYEKMLL